MKAAIPRHIAIIMDGNGRWAKKRFLPRAAGHKAGVDAAREVVKCCAKRNIEVLSLFAFSSENWNRPIDEVNHIMDLFLKGLNREVAMLHENHIVVRFIGDRTRFSNELVAKLAEVEALTQQNTGMVLLIAVNYGGRWDIQQATKRLADLVKMGKITSGEITPELIAQNLSFSDLPDPDLFIRPSGELRISNFMLWQLAYAELYFTDTLWPDFDEAELERALDSFAKRERRYGNCYESTVREVHA